MTRRTTVISLQTPHVLSPNDAKSERRAPKVLGETPVIQADQTAWAVPRASLDWAPLGRLPGWTISTGTPPEYVGVATVGQAARPCPPMPVSELITSGGSDAQLASFIEGCQKVWPNVQAIVVTRLKRPKGVAVEGRILHVFDENGIPKDTAKADIEQFMRAATADAEKHGAGEYQFVAWGVVEMPAKNRRGKVVPSPDPTELHQQKIRIGEEEVAEAGEGVAIMRTVADVLKANSAAALEIANASTVQAAGYDGVIKVQAATIAAYQGLVHAHMTAESSHMASQVEFKKIEYQIGRAEHVEARQDRQDEEDRQERRRIADAEIRLREEEVAMKKEFISQAWEKIGGLVIMVVEDMKEKKRARGEKVADDPPAEPAAEPRAAEPRATATQTDGLPKRLAAVLEDLTEKQHERLVEIFGNNANGKSNWEIIVGASKQDDDEAFRNTMGNIDHRDPDIDRINKALRTAVEESMLTVEQGNAIIAIAFKNMRRRH